MPKVEPVDSQEITEDDIAVARVIVSVTEFDALINPKDEKYRYVEQQSDLIRLWRIITTINNDLPIGHEYKQIIADSVLYEQLIAKVSAKQFDLDKFEHEINKFNPKYSRSGQDFSC